MTNIKKPRGTLDILPAETRVAPRRTSSAARPPRAGSRKPLPTFESTELFDRGVGGTTDIVQKEMYTFTDRDGRSHLCGRRARRAWPAASSKNGLYAGAMPLKLSLSDQLFPL